MRIFAMRKSAEVLVTVTVRLVYGYQVGRNYNRFLRW